MLLKRRRREKKINEKKREIERGMKKDLFF